MAAPSTKEENQAKLSQPAPANPRQTGNNTFQFALGNGMQVLVIPDHRAPVATQMLWFKVGGVDDPPGLSGMAHFFEHMMLRGTKQVPDDNGHPLDADAVVNKPGKAKDSATIQKSNSWFDWF